MQRIAASAGLAAMMLTIGCAGYGNSPTDPGGAPSLPTDVVVIDIVGIHGAQSFSPNPATIPAGHTVVWHNTDSATHRVMFDDGELDTGNIGPGRFSQPMPLIATGPYHCSIHPEMTASTTSAP